MSQISFRRIRGRIVPMKISKEEKKDISVGAKAILAGGTVATGGGYAYKKVVSKATEYAGKAASSMFTAPRIKKGLQMSFDDLAKTNTARESALNFMMKAKRLEQATPFIRTTSVLAGAALIGYGASKLAKGISNNDNKKSAQALGAAAGSVATAAFYSGAYPKRALKVAFTRAKQTEMFKTGGLSLIKRIRF